MGDNMNEKNLIPLNLNMLPRECREMALRGAKRAHEIEKKKRKAQKSKEVII